MASVQRVFEAQPDFNPKSAEREFVVITSDYAMSVMGGALREFTAEAAPGVMIRLDPYPEEVVERAVEILRSVDGLIIPHGFLSNLPYQDLYEDGWVCLVATSNSRVGDELTMELLAELPWVFTYLGPTAFTPPARQLQTLGVEPRVQIVVASFLALPFVVAGTNRLALVQQRLAGRLTASGDVRALPLPFDAIPIAEALWWHPMYDRDPGHIWLREHLRHACSALRPA